MFCIKRSQICDGYADLTIPDMKQENRFKFCGDARLADAYYFVDEAYCAVPEVFGAIKALLLVTLVLVVVTGSLAFWPSAGLFCSAVKFVLSHCENKEGDTARCQDV